MSLLSNIKKILPGSSRSLHAMHEDMDRRFDEVFARIEQADKGINMNINYKFDTRLFPEIDLLKQRQQSLSEQMALRFELLARRAYPDLTPFELRCKIFDALPDAEGDIRLVQQANAALMSKLDAICTANNIQYWLSYGSLVGTLSRSGFIPWDDDIDICMIRSDVDKLTAALKNDPEYQITLVYDWFVKCRQVRFCSKSSFIPCFIDISIYDWAVGKSKHSNDQLRQLRIELMDYFDQHECDFSFWRDNPWMFHPESGFCVQCGDVDLKAQRAAITKADVDRVQEVFDQFNDKAHELCLLTSDPCGDFAYAIDNMFNAPKRKIIWDQNDILPVGKHAFEDFSFSIPSNAEGVADDCFPGWPYMPMDICGHDHFAKDVLSDPDVRSAMARFVDECN